MTDVTTKVKKQEPQQENPVAPHFCFRCGAGQRGIPVVVAILDYNGPNGAARKFWRCPLCLSYFGPAPRETIVVYPDQNTCSGEVIHKPHQRPQVLRPLDVLDFDNGNGSSISGGRDHIKKIPKRSRHNRRGQ